MNAKTISDKVILAILRNIDNLRYMEKSPEKIRQQLEFWLLKYYAKERNAINGKEIFTIFDVMNNHLKAGLIERLKLRPNELPALSLKIGKDSYIINTTERFIRLSENTIDIIEYMNFDKHIGFGDYIIKKRLFIRDVNVKMDGYYSGFVIKLKSGEEIEWQIPTGTPGFGFWNVTKRCELIGRKYLGK